MVHNNRAIEYDSFLQTRPITIGINSNGEFIVKFTNNDFTKITDNELVPMLRLLELDFLYFMKMIESLVSKFNKNEEFPQTSSLNFPWDNLIKTALGSEREYWIELSIPWLINRNFNEFERDLTIIAKNKRIGQQLRHRILKLLAQNR